MSRAAALGLLALFLFATGCTRYVYDNGYDRDYYLRRVEADVDDYVRRLDRALDLRSEQEGRIERLLESRTRHLLGQTRAYHHDRVYPFPRAHRSYGRVARAWWRDADRHIANVLTERQADHYFDLVRDGRLDDDGYDRGDGRRRRHSR
jgi:hypothetical protein